MSKYQKFIILLACIVIVGMCIYTPMYSKARYHGYNFVFQSPSWRTNCRVDLERVGIQIFAVLVISTGLFFIAPKRKKTLQENSLSDKMQNSIKKSAGSLFFRILIISWLLLATGGISYNIYQNIELSKKLNSGSTS